KGLCSWHFSCPFPHLLPLGQRLLLPRTDRHTTHRFQNFSVAVFPHFSDTFLPDCNIHQSVLLWSYMPTVCRNKLCSNVPASYFHQPMPTVQNRWQSVVKCSHYMPYPIRRCVR